MRHTTRTIIAGLAVSGGLALAFTAPAQAAVPTDLCAPGTTFSVEAADGVDPVLVGSVRDALTARGLVAADEADLSATIAPASEVTAGGDASVMAVALTSGELDPATTLDDDWAPALWTDGATPVNALLDASCGAAEPAPVVEVAPEPAAPTPAAPVAAPAAPEVVVPQSAPAAPEVAVPQAAPAAPKAVVPQAAPAAPAPAAPAAPEIAAPAAPATAEAKRAVDSVDLADRDCADFPTQAAAQTFFTTHGGPATDPHRLDADDDGIACESHFAGDDAAPSRDEARTINAGVPDVADPSTLGLVGGLALVTAGAGVAVRARRLD